jgi:cyclase
VGNIVYFSYSAPEMLRQALRRLRRRGRGRLISSHMGVREGRAVEHALAYLDRLEAHARAAWQAGEAGDAVLQIPIGECLSPGLQATPFEELFHGRNLESIVGRRLLVPELG